MTWKKIVAVFAVVAVGVVALVLGYQASRRERPEPRTKIFDKAEYKTAVKEASKIDDGVMQPVAEAASGSAATALPSSLPDRDGLAKTISLTLSAYASREIDGYVQMLRKQGVVPNEYMTSHPEQAADMWSIVRAFMVRAVFEPDKVHAIDATRGGGYAPEQTGPSVLKSRRDAGRPFLESIVESGRQIVESVLPGRFTGQKGAEFEGVLVLQFTFNPEGESWVLTEIRLYGVPIGAEVILPPL